MNLERADIFIAHYEYIASARMTPILREALFCVELRCLGVFEPRRICGHVFKPCFFEIKQTITETKEIVCCSDIYS